ncbi:N-acetylmannosamine kinase%3B transcriptional regulator%2C ROK family protein [Streptococcus pneumoniae]|nr:N-acetylmannosamine kinase%3B transcriptional regulator%2C ROK family protein [Streptococcus pneumoniae]
MDGKVFHGFSNSACEVGYMHMQDGAFQDLASTTALVEYVAAAHGDPVDQWNGRRIFKEATEGNKFCMEGIDRMVDYLGNVANPEVVILGGGIMGQEAILKPKIRTALKEALVPSLAEKTRLEFAKHQNTAGMLGAYYHFKTKQS